MNVRVNLTNDIPSIVDTVKAGSDQKNLKVSDGAKNSSSNTFDKSGSPKTQFRLNLAEEVERENEELMTLEYLQPDSVCLKISMQPFYFLFVFFRFFCDYSNLAR